MSIVRDCLYCGSEFQAKLQRKVFCSDKCRVKYNRERNLVCFYCGDIATSRDHIYPHSLQISRRARVWRQEIVNSCSSCNGILGGTNYLLVEDRALAVANYIYKKHRLHAPDIEWSSDELCELGYSLRKSVQSKIKRRKIAERRYLHAMLVARCCRKILDEIEREITFETLDPWDSFYQLFKKDEDDIVEFCGDSAC